MIGGTAQKPFNKLETDYARHMRSDRSVVNARAQYLENKPSKSRVRRKPIRKAKVIPPVVQTPVHASPVHATIPEISKKIPTQLGPWMEHVKSVQESNPELSYKEALRMAKVTYADYIRKMISSLEKDYPK